MRAEDVPADLRQELGRVAVQVAQEAAELIVAERPDDLGVASTKSSSTDVVTVMDQRAQDLLRARLMAARPQDGFFGEEEGGESGTSGITWVVDPIDGTVNYLYGIPAYAVSVAAVVGDPRVPGEWQPVAGAVVNPVLAETFSAVLDGGARLASSAGERTLRVVGPQGLEQALVGTGFGYRADRRAWQARVLAPLLEQVRDIRRMGSAALDLCSVAAGRLDAYYERGLNAWDLAAGWLIATEAGAEVTGLDAPVSAAMLVAGAPQVHLHLLAALRPLVAAAGEDHAPT